MVSDYDITSLVMYCIDAPGGCVNMSVSQDEIEKMVHNILGEGVHNILGEVGTVFSDSVTSLA